MGILKNWQRLLLTANSTNFAYGNSKLIIRNSHVVSYRSPPPAHSKATKIGAVAVGGAMWWWVIWHLWHEPDHITGEFEYPNPSKWSNAQLGIPREM